jgi:hypothetical protein
MRGLRTILIKPAAFSPFRFLMPWPYRSIGKELRRSEPAVIQRTGILTPPEVRPLQLVAQGHNWPNPTVMGPTATLARRRAVPARDYSPASEEI